MGQTARGCARAILFSRRAGTWRERARAILGCAVVAIGAASLGLQPSPGYGQTLPCETSGNPNELLAFGEMKVPRWIAENTAPFFTPDTSPQMIQWCVNMLFQASMQAIVESGVAAAETDLRAELARIRTPVLVIHGTADVSAPLALTGQRVAKLIPGSELRVYEGAPHGLFVTHLERVNADLLRFVRG